MQTYLYIGNNKQSRDQAALEHAKKSSSSFDTHIYDANEEGGIELVREIQQKISILPVNSTYTTIVVFDVDKITHPAQNAFLKTLEEPPFKSQILLTTSNPELLLPTIVSRALPISVEGESSYNPTIHQDFIRTLTTHNFSTRLKLIENVEVEEWIVNLEYALREALTRNDILRAHQISKLIIKAFNSIKLTSVNVNKKIVKQNLILD